MQVHGQHWNNSQHLEVMQRSLMSEGEGEEKSCTVEVKKRKHLKKEMIKYFNF